MGYQCIMGNARSRSRSQENKLGFFGGDVKLAMVLVRTKTSDELFHSAQSHYMTLIGLYCAG